MCQCVCIFVLIHFQEHFQIDAFSMKTLSILVWTEGLNAYVWTGTFQLHTYTFIIHSCFDSVHSFSFWFSTCYKSLNYACLDGRNKLGQEIYVNISPKITLGLSKCWLKYFPIKHFFTFAFAIFTLSDFKLTLYCIQKCICTILWRKFSMLLWNLLPYS